MGLSCPNGMVVTMASIRDTTANPRAFSGAKLMLFVGQSLVVILRDDKPEIPFPGFWDFPGGGREPGETPQQCVLRETYEEVSVSLAPADLTWSEKSGTDEMTTWLFAAHISASRKRDLLLGDEGQRLRLMTPEQYLSNPKRVPHLASGLERYLSENAGIPKSPPPISGGR